MFVARLKAMTRTEHEALEGALPLMRPDVSHAQYRDYLEKAHGFYGPLEAALAAMPGLDDVVPHLSARRRAALAVADLEAQHCSVEALAERATAPFASLGEALGCLYVLEGSALGGRVIARHLQQVLALTPDALTFLAGRGERMGPLWQELTGALNRAVDEGVPEDDVVAGARACFRDFHAWFVP
jgi:heme oxygenase